MGTIDQALLVLPKKAEVAMPELLSMTFFRSGTSALYLALFMTITKVVVYKLPPAGSNSA